MYNKTFTRILLYNVNSLEPDFSFTNLKMMSESSKRRTKLLSLIFILNWEKKRKSPDLRKIIMRKSC